MNKKNNKGFTLLELLVAIFIFTTVIFIGYKIIDKSTIAIKDQGNINKGQLTMNDMNNYLTKDLEQADKVEIDISRPLKILDEDKENFLDLNDKYIDFINDTADSKLIKYTYTVKIKNDITKTSFDDKKIISKYITTVEYKEKKYKYNISRIDFNNTKIEFIDDELLTKLNAAPFIIKGGNPYEISMQYNGKNNKPVKHDFSVTSRYNKLELTPEIPWKPIKPSTPIKPEINPPILPIIPNGYDAIGYWTANIDKKPIDNLYSWINNELSRPGNQDKVKNQNNLDKFNIMGRNGDNGNSGHTWAEVGYPNDKIAYNDKGTTIKPMNIRSIYIYVSKGATLSNVKDNIQGKYKTIIGIEGIETNLGTYELKGGTNGKIYKCILAEKDKNDKRIFNITGLLSIDKNIVDTGYAMILYGKGNDDINGENGIKGDLVFEYIKSNETQNIGEFNWIKKIKYDMLDKNIQSEGNQLKHGEYQENINIFLNTMDGNIKSHTGGNVTCNLTNKRIQNIVGLRIKLEGNISIENFSFPGYLNQNLDQPNMVYEFKGLSKQQHNISGNVSISKLGSIGDKSRILIDFIYDE